MEEVLRHAHVISQHVTFRHTTRFSKFYTLQFLFKETTYFVLLFFLLTTQIVTVQTAVVTHI